MEYFENETRLVWVILPDEECVLVYHKPKPSKLLQLEDSLDSEDVIPNFNLPLLELFQELSFWKIALKTFVNLLRYML